MTSRNTSDEVVAVQRELEYYAAFYHHFQRFDNVARRLSSMEGIPERYYSLEVARILYQSMECLKMVHPESQLVERAISALRAEYPKVFEDIGRRK